ncbi:hypothetical protein Zmor_008411 [Zophobas morio]|uniref:Uncharacterized protein n=1 Tax=Zophobas morio TaxID=2755281 RepID=A0AA38J2A3_9CUCU|nr:hypothetical protein Zmor_008411 [Zophobas morio]
MAVLPYPVLAEVVAQWERCGLPWGERPRAPNPPPTRSHGVTHVRWGSECAEIARYRPTSNNETQQKPIRRCILNARYYFSGVNWTQGRRLDRFWTSLTINAPLDFVVWG